MMPDLSVQTVVADASVFEVSVDRSDAPRTISVELKRDGNRVRGWEEPGWRDVGVGVSRGRFYWWSARRLVVCGAEKRVDLEADTDEDILLVFASASSWAVVCESTIVLIGNHGERLSRLELDDTIETCSFSGERFFLRLSNGIERVAEVTGDELRAV